jgi:hypothetical protein
MSTRISRGEEPRAAIRPGASVFSAAMLPSGANINVFAAPIAIAASLGSSASSSAACLCGIVTFAPTKPDAPSERVVSANSCGGTGSR